MISIFMVIFNQTKGSNYNFPIIGKLGIVDSLNISRGWSVAQLRAANIHPRLHTQRKMIKYLLLNEKKAYLL